MSVPLTLSESPQVRYATGAMMYFAQGIPQGLLAIAIPAWLVSLGVSASDIGSYLAIIVLPWAFKLVAGPLMERFEFLPMGKRRPWALAAQFGLSLSLLSLMFIEQPTEQMGLLMLIGVLINSFAALQDVAVDGMSIDMTPAREQGRLNAFMSFGKAVGWGVTSAVSGVLLVTWGMKVTAIVAAVVAGIVLLAFAFVLEREGERRLPWSAGEAASVPRSTTTFRTVFGRLNKVLWTRSSMIVMTIMLFEGLVSGYGQALMPIAAVNLFGFTSPEWSQLVAVMGLIGAVVALALGPLIDRFGAKRMLMFTVTLVGAHALLLAQTQQLWQDTLYVRVMLAIWVLLLPVTMVSVIALAMAICSSTISATQFAVYMSVASLGYSAGSKIYGMVAESSTYAENYTMLAMLVLALIVVLIFHGSNSKMRSSRKERSPRFTMGLAGGEAGVFWSGAMRCPKCRSDMEQIVYQDIEIDRCTECKGTWFDAIEVEALSASQAAFVVDTGDASVGKTHNAVEKYTCPRCNGHMKPKVDPKQKHIWYEACEDCDGVFFDAGEFRDLAEHKITDFFKGLAVPKRL